MNRLLFLLLLVLPGLAGAQQLPDSTLAALPLPALVPADSALPPATALPVDTLYVAAPDTVPAALVYLSERERQQLGRDDAKRHYRPGKGVFWLGVGNGAVVPVLLAPVGGLGGVVGGLGGAVTVGAVRPNQERLRASAPDKELLRDADYRRGYAQKAQGKRMGKAMLGWGVGTTALFGTLIVTLAVLFSGFSAG